MKNLFLFLFIIIPFIGISQSYKLSNPDITDLKKQLDEDNFKEIIYVYLEQQYEKVGEQFDVKTYEGNQNEVCAFKQRFENNILYVIDQCPEEGGMNYNVTLPKTNRESLIEWIEIMDNNDISEIENSWNNDKTMYRPTDEGVGCYYTIKETETNTIVEIWCGC